MQGRISKLVWIVLLAASESAWGQVTQRVSVASDGAQANLGSGSTNSVSSDGRYAVFPSAASNLTAGDANGLPDVFVRDRVSGTTELVSVDSGGTQGNAQSLEPRVSSDGRFVSFTSDATNLVVGDTNGVQDVFLRDRRLGTTARVSIDSSGAQGNGSSYGSSMSADGRYVVFRSVASNLVAGDTNGMRDIFLHDRVSGATERIDVDSNGNQASGTSFYHWISSDGRFVVFDSTATNLAPEDTNPLWDIFLRDRQNGTTVLVSTDSSGVQGNDWSGNPAVSDDGRFVAFQSYATNFLAVDSNPFKEDIFVKDLQTGTLELASVSSSGIQGNDTSYNPSISGDGGFVSFDSAANNLAPGDTNPNHSDVYLRNRLAGTTVLVSARQDGVAGGGQVSDLSRDGRYVSFPSGSSLDPGDTNAQSDVFVYDRLGGAEFTSLCEPGVSGVRTCPCSNPPGGPGRGCDNSAATGGAILAAAGGTYLSSDSLVFTTSGEKPSALSVVAQWTGTNAAGVVFGMGVRCTSGTLKRLYTKSAVAGSITVPNFGAGDPSVSARSAAKGDVIQSGQSRWYVVYYRDPVVLGGCPSTSTFNATQTGQVTWRP